MISVLGILLATIICGSVASGNVSESFIKSKLVPDVLCEPPASLLEVTYPDGAVVSQGNILKFPEVVFAPSSVSWRAQDGVYYTVLMIDVDAPSRRHPVSSFLHWLVVNAQNNDVTTVRTVVEYLPPYPRPGTGPHRYMLLAYRQPSQLFISCSFSTFTSRMNFSPNHFAAEYNLSKPNGGNFFIMETLEEN